MSNPEIEMVRIPADKSACSVIGTQAVVWEGEDSEDLRGTPWDSLRGEWGINAQLYEMGGLGYSARLLALFVGIDKNDLHCYVTYNPDF